MIAKSKKSFEDKIFHWYDRHGRKDLPWQQPRTPYSVWVSEVMLQQTQVTTVIPYFQKFITHFPNVKQLAAATLEQVLTLWAGLGFYARARNLHKAAQLIVEHYGEIPDCPALLQKLPGIGRSTAGAILALGYNRSAPILDGNVKRLFTRLHAIEGWPGLPVIQKQLWELAESYLPRKRIADYSQALMDLGALVCKPQQPDCEHCPLQSMCLGFRLGTPTLFPTAKPKPRLPVRSVYLLLITDGDRILLEKRPPTGIWGGLWSLPESFDENINRYCEQKFGFSAASCQAAADFRHTFSHFHLDIKPLMINIGKSLGKINEAENFIWCKRETISSKALPSPIKKLLARQFVL